MVSQKPISVKLDYGIAERLTLIAGVEGRPKNRVINDAIDLYCCLMTCRLSLQTGDMTHATCTMTISQTIEAAYRRAYKREKKKD